MPTSHASRTQTRLALGVALIALLAHLIAAWTLPLGDDEGATLLERTLVGFWSDHEALNHPPPFRLAVLLALRAIDDLRILRLLSLVPASAAAGWLCWAVSRAAPGVGGLVGGLVAGLGLALTPWSLLETATLRPYGWTLLCAVAVVIALANAMARPSRPSLRWLAAAGMAAAWTHFALLPWVGLMGIALLRVGAAPAARVMGTRDLAQQASVRAPPLRRADRTLPLLALALGALGPLVLATFGAAGKSAGEGGELMAWAEWNPGLAPEPVLAALLLLSAGIHSGDRRLQALRQIAWLALPMFVGLVVMATLMRTLRWTHVVVLAPALWAGVGATIAAACAPNATLAVRAPAALRRWLTPTTFATISAAVTVGWIGWSGAKTWQSLAQQPLLADAHRLAEALDAARLAPNTDVAVWIVGVDRVRPGAQAVLAARGLYRETADRCVGADVVHSDRCRRRARWRHDVPNCQGFCDGTVCLWPASDIPTPADQTDEPARCDADACRPRALRTLRQALLPTGGLLEADASVVIAAAGLEPAGYDARRLGRWWWLDPRP